MLRMEKGKKKARHGDGPQGARKHDLTRLGKFPCTYCDKQTNPSSSTLISKKHE